MVIATPEQLVSTIYSSITKSVMDSMQLAQNQAITSQLIQISCNEEAVSFMNDQVNRCITELSKDKVTKTKIKKVCHPVIECNATNISIKSALNVTDLTNQTNKIKENINNSLANNIKQDLNSLNTSLLAGNKADEQVIDNITKLVSENTQNITQEVYNKSIQNQGLTLTNYAANNVTLSSVSEIVENSIQNINGMSDIINTLSTDITQQLSSDTNSLTKLVSRIMIISISVIGILFLILFMLKRKDTRDFIEMMTPYFLFLIGVFIILVLHIIIKPSYILNQENTKYTEINRSRFIFWCTFFSILLGAIEIIYYKFIKINPNNK